MAKRCNIWTTYRYNEPARLGYLSVDPLSDKYPSLSPYVYCANNPVKYIDPDGLWVWDNSGNAVAEEGDQANSLAPFLVTSLKNATAILNRCGVASNQIFHNGQSFDKNDLWVEPKSGSGAVVNSSLGAIGHYYSGSSEPAGVGDASTRELINSSEFQAKHTKITSERVQSTGNFSVNMTRKTFHIGRTEVDNNVRENGSSSSVTYTLFTNDGFWDPNCLFEKVLGGKKGMDRYKADGNGPKLEIPITILMPSRFGFIPMHFKPRPYNYKPRERTYFFKPVK